MPATATPRKPQTLARRLVETRNTSRNRSLAAMLGLGDSEKEAIRANASAVNDVYGRGTLAGFLGIPGDLGGLLWDAGAAVNNKIKDAEVALGLVSPQQARYVQSGGMNYGGAEHIGQKMQEYGLVSPTRRPVAETLASLVSPTGLYATVAKAPQMARAGVRALDNIDASPEMTKMDQRGVIRRFGIPEKAGEIIAGYDDTPILTSHPSYRAAKGGSADAGFRIAKDMIPASVLNKIERVDASDPVLVPMYSPEKNGYNKIPIGMAAYISDRTGIPLTPNIVQSSTVGHTGAKAMDRMVSRPLFGGDVDQNQSHILVDDVITMGGTMGEASNYIQSLGGDVGGIVSLINKSYGDRLNAPESLIKTIKNRFGNAPEDEFGIVPEALTLPEAEYLARFANADNLRNKAASVRAKK